MNRLKIAFSALTGWPQLDINRDFDKFGTKRLATDGGFGFFNRNLGTRLIAFPDKTETGQFRIKSQIFRDGYTGQEWEDHKTYNQSFTASEALDILERIETSGVVLGYPRLWHYSFAKAALGPQYEETHYKTMGIQKLCEMLDSGVKSEINAPAPGS